MKVIVRLVVVKHLEVAGRPRRYEPGDLVAVGKQLAHEWLASGEAVWPHEEIPEIPEPRVNIAGRYAKL